MLNNFCKSPPQLKLTGHVSLFHSNFSPLTHRHHKTLSLLLLASFTSPFQFALFSNILPSSHLSKDLISQCKSSHSLTLTLFSLSTLPFFIFYFPFLFLFTSIYIYLFYSWWIFFFFFSFYLLSPLHHLKRKKKKK